MAYHLHVVDGKTILVDARADFNQDNIRKFANKYFFGTEDGIVHCGKGHFFGAGALFYYNIQSIEHGLVVVSWGQADDAICNNLYCQKLCR